MPTVNLSTAVALEFLKNPEKFLSEDPRTALLPAKAGGSYEPTRLPATSDGEVRTQSLLGKVLESAPVSQIGSTLGGAFDAAGGGAFGSKLREIPEPEVRPGVGKLEEVTRAAGRAFLGRLGGSVFGPELQNVIDSPYINYERVEPKRIPGPRGSSFLLNDAGQTQQITPQNPYFDKIVGKSVLDLKNLDENGDPTEIPILDENVAQQVIEAQRNDPTRYQFKDTPATSITIGEKKEEERRGRNAQQIRSAIRGSELLRNVASSSGRSIGYWANLFRRGAGIAETMPLVGSKSLANAIAEAGTGESLNKLRQLQTQLEAFALDASTREFLLGEAESRISDKERDSVRRSFGVVDEFLQGGSPEQVYGSVVEVLSFNVLNGEINRIEHGDAPVFPVGSPEQEAQTREKLRTLFPMQDTTMQYQALNGKYYDVPPADYIFLRLRDQHRQVDLLKGETPRP